MAIASINPATGEVLRTFEPLSDSQIEAKIQTAAKTFPEFRKLPFADRAKMMSKAAEILEAEAILRHRAERQPGAPPSRPPLRLPNNFRTFCWAASPLTAACSCRPLTRK